MKKKTFTLIQVISIIPLLSFGQIFISNGTDGVGQLGSITISPKGIKGLTPLGNFNPSNVVLGELAGLNTTGGENTAIGSKALLYNRSKSGNIAIGNFAMLLSNNSTVSGTTNNLAIGNSALMGINLEPTLINDYQASLNTGTNNVALGHSALIKNSSGGNNTALGNSAGVHNTSGSSNVFIGNNSGGTTNVSNKLFIANSNTDNPLIKGDFSTGHLKINNKLRVGFGETPTATVDIAGDYAITSKKTINGIPYNNLDREGSSIIKIQGQTVITGIAGGTDGLIVHIYLLPGADLEIRPRSSLSLPENQIIWSGNINAPSLFLTGGGSISIIYDGPAGSGGWRVLSVFKP